MIFGLLSLTGIFAILGIPAVIMAAIALKKTPENKGFSITGLITGIVSIIFSIIAVFLFIVFVILAAASDSSSTYNTPYDAPSSSECQSWDKYCTDDESSDDPTKQPQSA